LILEAQKDFAVDNSYNPKLCSKVSSFCSIKVIQGKYEIFLEKNKPREQALQEVIDFFHRNNSS